MTKNYQSMVRVFQRLDVAFLKTNFPSICLKPLQVKCFEYLIEGNDLIAVLPTGFGKSLLFQILPFFLPTKFKRNIVIVVCPLSSIIEGQIKTLSDRGVVAGVLQCERQSGKIVGEKLFDKNEEKVDDALFGSSKVLNGEIDILFSHPETLLSPEGRKLMKTDVFQKNVVACAIDEAHCVEMW